MAEAEAPRVRLDVRLDVAVLAGLLLGDLDALRVEVSIGVSVDDALAPRLVVADGKKGLPVRVRVWVG